MGKITSNDPDSPPLDTVKEFQRRRELATRRGGPFLVLTFLCVIALVVLFNIEIASPVLRVNLFLFLLIAAFVSWGLHLYFDAKYNRCPNCEHIPINSRGKVEVDPVVCPRCGARLRAYDSLFF